MSFSAYCVVDMFSVNMSSEMFKRESKTILLKALTSSIASCAGNGSWKVSEPSDKTREGCLRFTKFFITGRVSEKNTLRPGKVFTKLMSTLTKKGGVSKT